MRQKLCNHGLNACQKKKTSKIVKSEEIVNQQHKWFRTKETLHTLSDHTKYYIKNRQA